MTKTYVSAKDIKDLETLGWKRKDLENLPPDVIKKLAIQEITPERFIKENRVSDWKC